MKLLITHTLPPGITREQVTGFARITQTDPNVKGLCSYVNLSQRKATCVFEAPSREHLARWMDDHQMPYDEIWPVELEGQSGEFHEVPTPVCACAGD